MTSVIPRIPRTYPVVPPLFPPWVSTAGYVISFAIIYALMALMIVMIAMILFSVD